MSDEVNKPDADEPAIKSAPPATSAGAAPHGSASERNRETATLAALERANQAYDRARSQPDPSPLPRQVSKQSLIITLGVMFAVSLAAIIVVQLDLVSFRRAGEVGRILLFVSTASLVVVEVLLIGGALNGRLSPKRRAGCALMAIIVGYIVYCAVAPWVEELVPETHPGPRYRRR